MTVQLPIPPKLAPEGTPFAVALYLDRAAEQLKPLVKTDGLDLKPYEICHPEDYTWGHHLFGQIHDRHYGIQIIANDVGAQTFKGIVIGFVLQYVDSEEVWLELEYRDTLGMAGMAAAVSETLQKLRLICFWGMPHVTEPDIKT